MSLLASIVSAAIFGIVAFSYLGYQLARKKYFGYPPESEQLCQICKHFNLEKGQASMRKYPIFLQAAMAVPPQIMGAECDEQGVPKETDVPEETCWEEFGACALDPEALWWSGDHCRHWAGGKVWRWPWMK